jgi:hypothetical protein
MSGTSWRLFRLLGLNTLISVLLSAFIWKFALQRDFNLRFGAVEIDFLNILGIVFTIIGLVYTFLQIADLPTREELIAKATENANRENFRWNATLGCVAIKGSMQTLQSRVNTELSFSEKVLSEYVNILNESFNTLTAILIYQKGLKQGPLIDCEKCVTLLKETRDETYKVIEEKSYASFKKQTFNGKIETIRLMIVQHEADLKF